MDECGKTGRREENLDDQNRIFLLDDGFRVLVWIASWLQELAEESLAGGLKFAFCYGCLKKPVSKNIISWNFLGQCYWFK
ncbi:hypothetical protein ACP4OV_001954 [Aristida adscensionis]